MQGVEAFILALFVCLKNDIKVPCKTKDVGACKKLNEIENEMLHLKDHVVIVLCLIKGAFNLIQKSIEMFTIL